MSEPGRTCPLHYRYRPIELCREREAAGADVLYVVGGLYGNPLALTAIESLASQEQALGRRVRLIFNGDFNWFNVESDAFAAINNRVLTHDLVQGNVEHELASPDTEAGCGCAYPDFVDDGVVERSNRIMQRLRATAGDFPAICEQLHRAPRWRSYRFAGETVLVLHGDPESLAGWGLAHEYLSQPGHETQIHGWFAQTGATVFASTHTCLPAIWQRGAGGLSRTVINNGSAGMGNLRDDTRGLITRLATTPARNAVQQVHQGSLYLGLIPVPFDATLWLEKFDRWWPADSDAAVSYRSRLARGTDLNAKQILL